MGNHRQGTEDKYQSYTKLFGIKGGLPLANEQKLPSCGQGFGHGPQAQHNLWAYSVYFHEERSGGTRTSQGMHIGHTKK